jgi:hypothetical protein
MGTGYEGRSEEGSIPMIGIRGWLVRAPRDPFLRSQASLGRDRLSGDDSPEQAVEVRGGLIWAWVCA